MLDSAWYFLTEERGLLSSVCRRLLRTLALVDSVICESEKLPLRHV